MTNWVASAIILSMWLQFAILAYSVGGIRIRLARMEKMERRVVGDINRVRREANDRWQR